MQFTRLRLTGFKSFVDPTELVIEPGTTGIVGPNGCGKSNLVEAMRWVMGENSAKRMRGSEMDDVIFGGTTSRPPRNLAEVGLLVDNSDGSVLQELAGGQGELEIMRRIERGSGSAYRVNGKEVRARDVQLLFADAATGAHSTALVSQGRIGAIINAKPTERRGLLEEAAGISGLHSRRHEAELRLKAAEANLSRLDDVIVTLKAQFETLRKQARQAQRYRRLSEQIRRAEAILLHLRWQAATEAAEIASARLRAAERQVGELTAAALATERGREDAASVLPALRQTEAETAAELQRLTLARESLEQEERRVLTERGEAERRLQQLSQDRRREDEIGADAASALTRLGEEKEELQASQEGEAEAREEAALHLREVAAAVAELEKEITAASDRLAAAEAERGALMRRQADAGERHARFASRIGEVEKQLAALKAEAPAPALIAQAKEDLAEAEAKAERARNEAEAAEEALSSARNAEAHSRTAQAPAETRVTKLRAEAQALTELLSGNKGRDGQRPLLDSLRVDKGFEAALAAALGDDLTAPLDIDAPASWTTLPPLDAPPPLPSPALGLAAHVEAPPALARRLSQIGIVDDSGIAASLQERLLPGQRLVSASGAMWRWDGYAAAAGTPTRAALHLKQRNRLAEVEDELALAEAQLDTLRDSHAQAQEAAVAAAERERQARQAMREALASQSANRDRHAALAQREAAMQSKLAGLTENQERLRADLEEAAEQRHEAAEALASLPDAALARSELQAERSRLAERRAEQLLHQGEHDRIAREATLRQQRLVSIALEERSWRNRVDSAARQMASLAEREAELNATIAHLSRRPEEIMEQRESLAEAIETATVKRRDAGDALALGETALSVAEKAAKGAESVLAAAREERVRCEGMVEQTQENQAELTRRIAERLDCAPEAILAAAEIPTDEILPNAAESDSRLERLVRERDGMGPVNLMAEQEAAELEERVTGLDTEREDLIAAIARLRQGIAALNREGRDRLLAAFQAVNAHFEELFVRLFGGGHAHLTLEEREDPLDCGLEIMASPPGKRLQSLSLLSGGEQALTALALLFAVFLTNPAPICVLDEVDAPLDDANVDRFCRLVEEISVSARTRFLVITHHRLTMARMDRLFGVTMAERGISQLVSVDLQSAERLRKTA